MNEKLKELAEQAVLAKLHNDEFAAMGNEQLERFAELVRQDEREKCAKDYLEDCARAIEKAEEMERQDCAKHYLEITRDAVKTAILKEREQCAKLCDELSNRWYDEGGSANDCAQAIRGRTELKSDFKNQMDDNWAGLI